MDKFILYYPVDHQKHNFFGHPERPERVDSIRDGLIELGIWQEKNLIAPINLDNSLIKSLFTLRSI